MGGHFRHPPSSSIEMNVIYARSLRILIPLKSKSAQIEKFAGSAQIEERMKFEELFQLNQKK